MVTAIARKQVYVATATPEECIAGAQIAIVTDGSCHLIGRQRAHINTRQFPMPAVACPIVDVSAVPEAADEQLAQAMKQYTNTAGVTDLPALIEALVHLGATVSNRPCEVCEGTQKQCDTCTYGVIQ